MLQANNSGNKLDLLPELLACLINILGEDLHPGRDEAGYFTERLGSLKLPLLYVILFFPGWCVLAKPSVCQIKTYK